MSVLYVIDLKTQVLMCVRVCARVCACVCVPQRYAATSAIKVSTGGLL